MSSLTIKKVYTENPYADELIYYTKVLALDTVLKNEQEALKCETEASLKASGLFMMCRNNRIKLTSFNELDYEYARAALKKAGYTEDDVDRYTLMCWCNDTSIVTESSVYYKILLEAQKQYYLDNYEELNDYYRMLNGLPPIGVDDIYVTENFSSQLNIIYDFTSTPLHKLPENIIAILGKADILQQIYEEEPEERGWILHLNKKVDPYYARRAFKFEAIYIPPINSDAVTYMFKEKLEANRIYTMRTIYSEAYKFGSSYYDSMIAVFIIINTMIDIISRIEEFITRKEIFDIRSCKYLFESYGVAFFEEIPLRYQIKMVKNIHSLIKYKSTSKCMLKICSLFGFDNIEIFKYYLLKDRSLDDDGHTIFDKDMDIDNTPMYFVKIPLDGAVDDYIRNTTNYTSYDRIAEEDVCWNGGLVHKDVKKDIMDLAFNYTRTKYYSIDAMYDLYKVIIQQTYFFNMLYDNKIVEETALLSIPSLSTTAKFKLSDCFVFLSIMQYQLRGMKDMLMDTEGKILYVYGFNFNADLTELRDKVYRTKQEQPNPDAGLFIVDQKEIIDSGPCGDEATYVLYNTGEMIISGTGAMWDYKHRFDVDFSEPRWYFFRRKIIKVTIENGITAIGSFAFDHCSNMIDVYIPDSVTHIGDYAFWSCNSLKNVDVPSGVNYMGTAAFGGNPSPLQQWSETAFDILDEDEGFIIPTTDIPTVSDLMDLYVHNMNCHDKLIEGMRTADNYRTFNIYKDLYEALCTMELTMDFFCDDETGDYYRDYEGDATLTEFLRHRDQLLYTLVKSVDDYSGDYKSAYIAGIVDQIIYSIEEYIDSKKFTEIFINVPTMDKDSVLSYIKSVINFYKSYKIELLGVNVVYTFDDKNEGYLKLIDDLWIKLRIFTKPDLLNIYDDAIDYLIKFGKEEVLDYFEEMKMEITKWKTLGHPIGIRLRDKISEMKNNINENDFCIFSEALEIIPEPED